MNSVRVSLNTINKVKAFVRDITKFEYDFKLISERYVIDAKSIMGIFSLDITKPMYLSINTDERNDDLLNVLSVYMI